MVAVGWDFMSDILNKTIVLVLNRNWQAINIRTPADAFCQMATNAATALDIELGNDARAEALRPVAWDEWITLPIRASDNAVMQQQSYINVQSIQPVKFTEFIRKAPGKFDARVVGDVEAALKRWLKL